MKSRHDVRGWALAIALVALALVAGAMLALADTADHPLPQAESDAAVAGPQVAPHGVATVLYTTLVDVQAATAQTLDPHWLFDANSARVVAQVYETLLTRRPEDPEMLVPYLATGWEAAADAKTFTFTIRSNVTFHQGGSLEPHDVAYSVWRGMIQDRVDGPMWMWFDLFFDNVWQIEDLPGDDLAKCQAVKEAVTYDDAAGTVTFHLAEPAAVFLAVLETPSASVLDQEWMADNGGWAGSCADWRDYHDPAVDASLLYDRANGTGPFRLSHWTAGEVRLERHEGYWRRPAALEAVVIQHQASWPARRDMLIAGQADLVQVPLTGVVELEPYVWGVYQGLGDGEPTLVNPGGTLRLFRDLPGVVMYAGLFCHGIEPTDNPYIGSGALDGNGIPPGFFADLHVRQAFNYAFDWSALIQSAYAGEAQRARGPIPEGLMGYTDAQPVYVYSPTLSAQAFQQALGGEVWSQGFSMTVAYNEGNLERQAFAEMLAQGVEAINPSFHVGVVGLPWSDLLAARQSRLLPVYVGGWGEDYHHPHNWVHPFLYSTGAYGGYQNFEPGLADSLDATVEECAALTDLGAARTCYQELQDLAYVHATAMYGMQRLSRTYLRSEVRGYAYRPGISYPDYYALSKGLPPTQVTLEAGTGTTVEFPHTSGTATTTLEVPAGAVSEMVEVVHTPDVPVAADHPGGFRLGGLTFDLVACLGGECQPGYAFDSAVTVTLHYDDADVAGLIEEELYLYTWDGSAWVDVVADCGLPSSAYGRYPAENRLVVPLCHLSPFTLVGGTHDVYLPLVARRR